MSKADEISIAKLKNNSNIREADGKSIEEANLNFRTIFDLASDGMLVGRFNDKKITDANKKICKMLGYTKEEVLDLGMSDIHPVEQLSYVVQQTEMLFRKEIQVAHNIPLLRKDKSVLFTNVTGGSIIIKGKEYEIGIFRDVSENKMMEDAIKNSEIKYRSIFENAIEGIFQVTTEGRLIAVNKTLARMTGYDSPSQFIESIKDIKTQLYVRSEDREKFLKIIRTSGFVKGFETEFYRKDKSTFWVGINAIAVKDEDGNILFNEGLIEDISLRKQTEETLLYTFEILKKEVNTAINVILTVLETRDPYTAGHQFRSANLACAIAAEMGLSSEKNEGLRMASAIHDIGKLSIPVEILSKPIKLTSLEFSLIKEHSRNGFEILKDVESIWPLAQIVYQHHERMNGTGYPRNLKGDEIIIEARILAVADVVEAMASHRPYRASLGIEAALKEIEKNKGILYDENVVDACLKIFREKDYKLITYCNFKHSSLQGCT